MNETILSKMKEMKLMGMARAFQASHTAAADQRLSADELVEMLVTAEWDDRSNRKQDRFIKNARFRYRAMVEQISFDGARGIYKNQILRLAD